ncbi:hypothetical protein [Treponema lecithinolyticum]|uniref:hypothetical protein n=1 Tax=Treponema lecithinolyticum TaxID=53418 RepID=UPI0028E5F354|nr:hypothetical protein [Treponema lecithinolyticum]
MKKIFFTAAVLAAVCIGFIGCANAAGGGADNPPPAVNHPLTAGTYNVNATLSVYAPAMKLDLAKGQPDKGEKYKPLVEGASVTVDKDGKMMLTVNFRKSYVKVFTIEANTFIDPRNSTPGYYDMGGVKRDAPFTLSTDDTADDPAGQKVHYVTSMTFPVSKDKSVYFLWLYLNSSVMGAQSGDGKGDAGPNAPNQHSKYEGKFTVDWSTLTKK